MKKYGRRIFALAIVGALVFTLSASAFAAEFTDMPSQSNWAYTALTAAVENGLITGNDNGKLNPTANLSRAEMATIISRAFGATQATDISAFKDVSADAWYYSALGKAVKMGVFTGDAAGTMRPGDPITRQEAFVVLSRAIKLTSGDTAVLSKFSDSALVADWAKSAIAAMVAAGYVEGSDGKLNPTGTITRQEFAQVMYNTINSYISKAGTVTSVKDGNVMVNAAGVYLKDITVKGDLIVGDGVGIGDLTLDNVKVSGRMVVRGGGSNSIIIINKSSVGNIVVAKTSDGAVHINADSTSDLEVVYVADGKDGVIVEGSVTTLTIAGTTSVEIKGTVSNVVVTEEAKGATINVASDATVGNLDAKADNIIVSGSGKITSATVSGDNAAINVIGTKVTVDENASGTTLNGETATGGTQDVVKDNTTSSGGGGGVTTYETQIDTLINAYIAILNSKPTSSAFASTSFNSSTNIATCTLTGDFTAGTAYTAIDAQLTGHSSDVSTIRTFVMQYISSITIGSHTETIDNSLTHENVRDFLYSSLGIDGSTQLNINHTYTIIVTDKLGNNITYTFNTVAHND